VLAIALLVVALVTGLILALWVTSTGRPVRPQLTRFIFDDKAQHYWDGRTWQPVVSRYAKR
jgi:hypothetical protein